MGGTASAAPLSESIVAKVNGTMISLEAFNRAMDDLKVRHVTTGRKGVDYDSPEVKTEVLESLINQELLFQEARRQGFKVKEETIDTQLEEAKEQYGSEAAFRNALAAVNQSEAELRQQLRRYLMIQELVHEWLSQQADISEETLRAYYERHPQRCHILIKVRPDAAEEQKQAARSDLEALRVKLEEGEDFLAVVQEFTERRPNAEGGDLELVMRGQMPRPFEDAAFALEPDSLSQVVETDKGFYLIKVIDNTPQTSVPFEKVREELKKRLTQEKVQQDLRGYIAELRERATIKRYLLDE
jgi:peptidyl-prolyl cis-trans isomerase C